MHRRFFIAAALLVLSATAIAQHSDVAITGSVREVKVAGRLDRVLINPKNEFEGSRFERKETWFEVYLNLNYCNRGDVNLIVPLRRAFPNTNTIIEFLDIPSPGAKVSATVTGKDFGQKSVFMERFLSDLKGPLPQEFKVIEPNTCYESTDMVRLDSGYKVDVLETAMNQWPIEFARAEHPYFRLQYSFSMKDTLPVYEARARWGRIGKLVTTADGDFFFKTDVIINKLPDKLR